MSGNGSSKELEKSKTSWIAEPKGHYQEVDMRIQTCPQSQASKPKAQKEKHQV